MRNRRLIQIFRYIRRPSIWACTHRRVACHRLEHRKVWCINNRHKCIKDNSSHHQIAKIHRHRYRRHFIHGCEVNSVSVSFFLLCYSCADKNPIENLIFTKPKKKLRLPSVSIVFSSYAKMRTLAQRAAIENSFHVLLSARFRLQLAKILYLNCGTDKKKIGISLEPWSVVLISIRQKKLFVWWIYGSKRFLVFGRTKHVSIQTTANCFMPVLTVGMSTEFSDRQFIFFSRDWRTQKYSRFGWNSSNETFTSPGIVNEHFGREINIENHTIETIQAIKCCLHKCVLKSNEIDNNHAALRNVVGCGIPIYTLAVCSALKYTYIP